MARPTAPLHLPRPGGSASGDGPILRRSRGRRRRRLRRLRQAGMGLLLAAVGMGMLAGLVRLPDRLDALLLVSHALANVIGGLNRLGLGLLQLTGVLLVVLLALLALLLLVGGAVRLWRALLPPVAAPPTAVRSEPPSRPSPVRPAPPPPLL